MSCWLCDHAQRAVPLGYKEDDAATTMLRTSGNLKLTQRMLGHASIQSTMRYAHATEDDLRAALNAMSPISPEAENADAQEALKTKAK